MQVNVSLYGDLAQNHDGHFVSTFDYPLADYSTIGDLLVKLNISPDQKGFTFVNAVLYDMPGLNASAAEPLKDGDHVGIFSLKHMWPYQYRDGIRMSDSLKDAMREHGAMHGTYRHQDQDS